MDIQQGILRSVSDTSPAHYQVRIQSFSLLTKNAIERYESAEFEAGGYKWKLVLYPSGNKSKNVKDHISLYLVLQETTSFPFCWEIYVKIRFSLLDQNKDNYLVVEDGLGMERKFYKRKVEWGYDELIPLKTFSDASNGYLVNDSCEFGAEVYVSRERIRDKGESLIMIRDAIPYKHTWHIDSYSKMTEECYDSQPFIVGNHKWKIQVYPRGRETGFPPYLSLYVALVEPTTLNPSSKIYTQIVLRILDQKQSKHQIGKANFWFSASSHQHGASKFLLLSTFINQYFGFLIKDNCYVEAEVTILGVVDALT
ncbi:BTB/POZ and MATH domain-containing protein 3 [Senna tora]|uniref:BTB/POZ and MATH domain-containing protein 3 n=1 Tax=Senna tora TaxID=362788 RepID=A0A834X3D3_9FABA|nr:BTB/POZ and MATH domain-containing protein 3 [Senna tora]